MKIIVATVVVFCGLTYFPAMAQENINKLIKEQQRNDSNIRQQNQINKKDIYSSVEPKKINSINTPEESPCFRINNLIISDDFLRNKAVGKIKDDITGRCLGTQGIAQLASSLQDWFIHAGYITTRVEIPEQDLSFGVLTLRVIPGRIEDVIIMNNDISGLILPFGQEDILNVRDVEQGLENLQRTPGMDVKINIEPGSRNGYSRVVIHNGRKTKWQLRVSENNWGDKSTGSYLTGVSGYLYNMAHINDIFYLAGTSSLSAGYNSISSYYSFPLGYWENEFFYSYSLSHQNINIDTLKTDYSGKNHYASLKTSRTFYRDRDKKMSVSIEALRRKSDYQLGDIRLKLQKRDMSNIRLAVNYKQNYAAAMLNSSLAYQRFTHWLGGSLSPDMVAGDVSSGSHLYSLEVNYLKQLSHSVLHSFYDLRLGMQYAPGALVLQDQLSINNRWKVRGFEHSAALYGDSGFYLQNTVTLNTGLTGAEYYCGLDYGEVAMAHTSQQQKETKRLMGAVTGLKGNIKALGYDLSLSVPLLYPNELKADKLTMNFNFYYQL